MAENVATVFTVGAPWTRELGNRDVFPCSAGFEAGVPRPPAPTSKKTPQAERPPEPVATFSERDHRAGPRMTSSAAPGTPVPPQPGSQSAAVAPTASLQTAAPTAAPSGQAPEEMRRESVELYRLLRQACTEIRVSDPHMAGRLIDAGSDLAMQTGRLAGQIRGGAVVAAPQIAEFQGLVGEIQSGTELAYMGNLASPSILDAVNARLGRIADLLQEIQPRGRV